MTDRLPTQFYAGYESECGECGALITEGDLAYMHVGEALCAACGGYVLSEVIGEAGLW